MNPTKFKLSALSFAVATVSAGSAVQVSAQEQYQQSPDAPIEEVLVTARQRDAAQSLVVERIEESHQVDVIGIEAISRAGDSDLAAALRRVPGLTLLGGKFVYVRGLGERYSSTQLNRAQVPSPDFSRNVLPLDLIPTDILESMAIQKSYSADLPAAFGGGNINIRTKTIPDEFLFSLEVGAGANSASSTVLTNGQGGDWLGKADQNLSFPVEISTALEQYDGNLSVSNTFATLRANDIGATYNQAVAINQGLAASINRDFDIEQQSADPETNFKLALGDNFLVSDDLELGLMLIASRTDKTRNKNRTTRDWAQPDDIFTDRLTSVNEISATGAFNVGVRYQEDHQLLVSSMFLRNTEDETSISTGNDLNTTLVNGSQERAWNLRYEQRELLVNQARGSHAFDGQFLDIDRLGFSWYYSDAEATSDIPSEVTILGVDSVDLDGNVLQTALRSSSSAASFNWTSLSDQVESYGWRAEVGDRLFGWDVTASGGYDYWNKVRDFAYVPTNISTAGVQDNQRLRDSQDPLSLPDRVLSDAHIGDIDSGLSFRTGGIGSESYIAVLQNHAGFGAFDVQFNENWRINLGARWEEYTQFSMPYDILDYTGSSYQMTTAQVLETIKIEDDWYPSAAVTYSNFNLMGAEVFQVRGSLSQTVVRPDLREISDATYIDTVTEFRVVGNPLLETSSLTNADLRFEWFYEDGDSFTVTAFYKDIADPIEAIQRPGSDDNVVIGYINADAANVYGIEFETLYDLSGMASGVFLTANLTLSDSEIEISSTDIGLTNNTRRMNGHSEWVANLSLGYDSESGLFAANLGYNVAGERIVFAGRNGAPDALEQPFHSLDFNVDFYPLDEMRVRLKAQNLLDERIEFSQGETTIVSQEVGTNFSVSLKYDF